MERIMERRKWHFSHRLSITCLNMFYFKNFILTFVLLIYPAFANSVDPDQLASKKPTDLDLHCLPFSM